MSMTVGQEKVFADIVKNYKKGGEFRKAAGKMYRSLLNRPTTKNKQSKAIRVAWDKLSAKETSAANKTATREQNEKTASRDLKMSKAKLAKQKAEAVGKTAAARRQAANKKAMEKSNSKSYREFKVDYKKFILDLEPKLEEADTKTLMHKAEIFFKRSGLLLNWKEFDRLDKLQKINTLSMIAPFTNEEKQKLLETISLKEKVKNLEDIINFYLHEVNFNSRTIQ